MNEKINKVTFLSCLLQEINIIVPALQFRKNKTVQIWFTTLIIVLSENKTSIVIYEVFSCNGINFIFIKIFVKPIISMTLKK